MTVDDFASLKPRVPIMQELICRQMIRPRTPEVGGYRLTGPENAGREIKRREVAPYSPDIKFGRLK